MKYLFFVFIVLITANVSYARSYFPVSDLSGETVFVSNTSDIKRLERKIFHQTFDYDTTENRLERLERKVFGACQMGTLDERVMLLKNASQNYKAYSNPHVNRPQYQRPVFTGSAGSNWRNMIMGNFMNQFIGTPTGFTPAMDPAYMDYFEAERAMSGTGDNYDYADNHRQIHRNTQRGSGMGVRILD
ncbi:hypothetical protein J6P92_05470 [bacterium]|nr:hypothetical protein [bacterium]